MRELLGSYLNDAISRRTLMRRLAALGFTAGAARMMVELVDASENAAKSPALENGSVTGTGGDLVVAQMRAAGVNYLFTNPGSFEVGLFDAFIGQPDMHLVMALHEGIVIAMADGYARVSGKPGFVNVHVIAGTAQMAGQLYNSARDGVPVVVTAGLLDNELWSDEVSLAPRPGFDQKGVTRQFTKISWEARQPASLPLMLRRALKTAAAPPGGPVYLAMAHYALEAKGVKAHILPADRFMIPARVRANSDSVEQAAKWLSNAKRPVILVGDEVWRSGATAELVKLAEKHGLAVAESTSGYRNFPTTHPNRIGGLATKGGADLVLALGARDFGGRVVPAESESPDGARLIRAGLDTAQMSRNYATDLALVGDVREVLKDLGAALDASLTKDRAAKLAAERRAMIPKRGGPSRANFGKSPIHPDELGHALATTLDKDTIFVSENLTGRHD